MEQVDYKSNSWVGTGWTKVSLEMEQLVYKHNFWVRIGGIQSNFWVGTGGIQQ